jgi:hypothetical protein
VGWKDRRAKQGRRNRARIGHDAVLELGEVLDRRIRGSLHRNGRSASQPRPAAPIARCSAGAPAPNSTRDSSPNGDECRGSQHAHHGETLIVTWTERRGPRNRRKLLTRWLREPLPNETGTSFPDGDLQFSNAPTASQSVTRRLISPEYSSLAREGATYQRITVYQLTHCVCDQGWKSNVERL